MFKFFRNLKLRTKLISSVLTVSLLVLVVISVYTHIWYQTELKEESIERLRVTSQSYAGDIEKIFEESMAMANTLSNTLSQMVASEVTDRKLAGNIIKDETLQDTQCESIWALWEPNAFDGKDAEYIDKEELFSNDAGRFAPSFFRSNGQAKYSPITENLLGKEFYQLCKKTHKPAIFGPDWYPYEDGQPPVRTLSINSPIMLNLRYLGVVGIDLSFKPFEKILSEKTIYPGSYTQIINHKGNVVYHPDTELVDKPFIFEGTNSTTEKILSNIRTGKGQLLETTIGGEKFYYSFYPIHISGIDTPWSLCIVVPQKSLMAGITKIIQASSLLFFPGIILMLVWVILMVNGIIRPINGSSKVLEQLSLGHISKTDQLPIKNNDEIGKMSQALNALTSGLREMLDFSKEIGRRNYAVEYHLLSEQDELGQEMLEMRNNLAESAEKENQFKAEEERRSWVNHGIAEFSEILRNNDRDLEALSYEVISKLVKYLDANQGGLFVVNNDDASQPYLELSACYAYERRKYQQTKINPGEGLIGTCYQEGETIYMNDIPDGYMHITSGIGKANPRVVVIVPMKINDIIYGVLEIASFKTIEPYQIDFLEKISTTTASTISTVKINLNTSRLLEQSQLQAQRLSEQEEEMRQNMEEMLATQEEMGRKNDESESTKTALSTTLAEMQEIQNKLEDEKYEVQSVMDAVDDVFMRITYDTDMTLLDINETCLKFHGTTREEMIGIKLAAKMNPKDIPAFEANWARVLAGETFKGDGVRKTHDGDKHVWYMYSPIKDASGKVHKVLMLGRFLDDI